MEFFSSSKLFKKTQPKAPSLGNGIARGEKERGKCVPALRKVNPKRILIEDGWYFAMEEKTPELKPKLCCVQSPSEAQTGV